MKVLIVLALLLSTLGTVSVWAGQEETNDIEFTGLIIEETMTPIGHNFYEAFNIFWKPLEGMIYTITISEKADSFRGSVYIVKIDDEVVATGRLNPRQEFIDNLAKASVKKCQRFLLRRHLIKEELELY
jgi:hypothetical protein